MRGYVAKRRNRFYAVIYEGIDPVTGHERRRWHPAGTDRAAAEQLTGAALRPITAATIAAAHRSDARRLSHPHVAPVEAGDAAAEHMGHLPPQHRASCTP